MRVGDFLIGRMGTKVRARNEVWNSRRELSRAGAFT